jgi:GNAT superfamily N-acetyltransferase
MSNPRNEGSFSPFSLSQNVLADPRAAGAYARLLQEVFDFVPRRAPVPDPQWRVLALFEPQGACVAGIEIAELGLVLDGEASVAMAIRLAGVAPSHRGRGLFRTLMEDALGACAQRAGAAPILLYTEDEALYTRFGFAPLVQHAFVGLSPTPSASAASRPVSHAEAIELIDRLAPRRAPVSQQCAVRGGTDLLRATVEEIDLRLAFLDAADALVIYEQKDAELVIVDIVATVIPTMTTIVGALAPDARRVRTLFPPDRLAWDGTPLPDDTGLMIRGEVPPAMRRPFMLPPTTGF